MATPTKSLMTTTMIPPIHQWTYEGDRVLLVKQIGRDRTTGGNGYPVIHWPNSGVVVCADWEPTHRCGHGIHAWPWGMGIGDGKYPDATVPWLVLAVDPEQVVLIDAACGGKVKVPAAEIVHDGTMATAMAYTHRGRCAWIRSHSGVISQSSGYRSSAASSGDRSSAASSGDDSSAASSGNGSSARATGQNSIAAINGDEGHIEVSATSIGAVWGRRFTWTVRVGGVILQRWEGGWAVLDSVALSLHEGQEVTIENGVIQKTDRVSEA